MKTIVLILYGFSISTQAIAENEANTKSSKDENAVKDNKPQQLETEILPDKDLLLFLSEFSDADDEWVDPEIFNQSYSEAILINTEIEEINNEDIPNNI